LTPKAAKFGKISQNNCHYAFLVHQSSASQNYGDMVLSYDAKHTLNRLGVSCVCDGQTYRHCCSKCHAYLRCAANKNHWAKWKC